MESVLTVPSVTKERAKALLIHGMTATTVEMTPLARHLADSGISSTIPLLPGHGTSLDELKVTKLSEFTDCVCGHFEQLDTGDVPVMIVGESFGALLSLWLAQQFPEKVKGLCLVSPPILFRSKMREKLLGGICTLPDFALNRLGLVPKRKRSLEHFQFPFISYEAHSIAAGARLVKLRRSVLEQMDVVQSSTCIIHDPDDHHLAGEALPPLLGKMNAQLKEFISMRGGEHELLVGPRSREVFNCIASFLERVLHAA